MVVASAGFIDLALAFATGKQRAGFTLVVPRRLDDAYVRRLLADHPEMSIAYVGARGSREAGIRIGAVHVDGSRVRWDLPQRSGRLAVVVESAGEVSFLNAAEALRHGCWRIADGPSPGWRVRTALSIILARLARYVLWSAKYRAEPLLRPLINRCRPSAVRMSRRLRRWLPASWRGGSPAAELARPLLDRSMPPSRQPLLPAIVAACRKNPPWSGAPVPGRIVIANAALAWGGAERQILTTIKGLAARGLSDVIMLCEDLSRSADLRFLEAEMRALGIRVVELADFPPTPEGPDAPALEPEAWWLARLRRSPHAGRILAYARALHALRPQVLHAWQDQTSIYAGIAGCMTGVPRIVLAARNMAPFHFPYFQPYMSAAYRSLSTVPNVVLTNNSAAGADDYVGWLGVSPARIVVIRNGIDLSRMVRPDPAAAAAYRRRLGIPPDAPVVGSVFRFYDEKRPLLWIDAAARIARARPDAHFVVIGVGPMREQAAARAARAGIADRLHLPGTEDDIVQPLAIMDVFLLASRAEGTPNVVIEAQALGVPAVVTRAGGAPEAVLDGETGWVVDPPRARLLAAAALRILDDGAWRRQAASRARTFARERYGLERLIDETIALYGLGAVAAGSTT